MQRRKFIALSGLAPLSLVLPSGIEGLKTHDAEKLRVGIAGLSHAHVHGLLGRNNSNDLQIVGIAETDRQLAARYAKQYGFSMDIVHDTIEEMLDRSKPVAVTAFNSIFGHLEVVEKCAPRGIHVMVEKPLAVSVEHANKMKALAEKHRIQLLTNYETTWYGTHRKAYEYLGKLGELRKMDYHTGHEGPMEIGVNKEFLDWLTDPVLNGAGALTDFGCYGANLSTWFMKGERPLSVSCSTQRIKPDVYPKVDDQCTILVNYKNAQAVIQASWNWPFSVKSTEVYGKSGFVICHDRNNISHRFAKQAKQVDEKIEENVAPNNDPFSFLIAVLKGGAKLPRYDLSSLENNMLVVEILDAAKLSAKTQKLVML